MNELVANRSVGKVTQDHNTGTVRCSDSSCLTANSTVSCQGKSVKKEEFTRNLRDRSMLILVTSNVDDQGQHDKNLKI